MASNVTPSAPVDQSVLVEKVTDDDPPVRVIHMTWVVDRGSAHIDFGNGPVMVKINGGTEITILHPRLLDESVVDKPHGKLSLQDVFGKIIMADEFIVSVALVDAQGNPGRKTLLACAVSDELVGHDALLSWEDFRTLRNSSGEIPSGSVIGCEILTARPIVKPRHAVSDGVASACDDVVSAHPVPPLDGCRTVLAESGDFGSSEDLGCIGLLWGIENPTHGSADSSPECKESDDDDDDDGKVTLTLELARCLLVEPVLEIVENAEAPAQLLGDDRVVGLVTPEHLSSSVGASQESREGIPAQKTKRAPAVLPVATNSVDPHITADFKITGLFVDAAELHAKRKRRAVVVKRTVIPSEAHTIIYSDKQNIKRVKMK
jgi:hypothetical protein